VTVYVNRMAGVVSDYFVENAYRTFRRESIDRILDLTHRLVTDGFPPMNCLDRIATDVVRITSSDRHLQRQTRRRRVQRVYAIGRSLSKSLGGAHRSVQRLFKAAREIEVDDG
jgi:hypothetical protein